MSDEEQVAEKSFLTADELQPSDACTHEFVLVLAKRSELGDLVIAYMVCRFCLRTERVTIT